MFSFTISVLINLMVCQIESYKSLFFFFNVTKVGLIIEREK